MKHNTFRKELYSKREDWIYDNGYKFGQHDTFVPMILCMIAAGIGGAITSLALFT